jgi:hypothetical protein
MTTSGQVNGNNVDGSEGSYLSWQIYGVTPSLGVTTLSWQVGWRFSTTSCRGLRLGAATIAGNTVYSNRSGGDGVHAYNSGHNHKPKLQVASGYFNIWHQPDGSAAFTAWVELTGWQGLYSAGSGTFSLPIIPPPTPAQTPVTRIKLGGVWKNATSYVKMGGVWRQATPYVRVGGTWKGTS